MALEDINNTNEENTNTNDDIKEAEDLNDGNDGSAKPEDENNEPERKYTDEDIDEIINQKFARWEKQKEEEISEAEKLAQMNAEEQREYETAKLKEKLDKLEREKQVQEMKDTARTILEKEDLVVSDGMLSSLITDKAETTKENVESFVKLFNEAVEKEVNEALKGKSPKKMTGENKPLDPWALEREKI